MRNDNQVQAAQTTFFEELQAELSGLEALADEIGSDLHAQADRLVGPEPSEIAQASPPSGGPQTVQVGDQLRKIKAKLSNAYGGVRRLRRIG